MKNFIIGIVLTVIVISGVTFYQTGKLTNITASSMPQDINYVANTNTYSATNTKNGYISKEDAKSIALNSIGGGKVIRIKFDKDHDHDDIPNYDIKIRYNNNIYEVEVNAITGNINDTDIDYDYDDC